MTSLKDPRPCPFCGSRDLKLEDGVIVCASCRARGPTKGLTTDAEEVKARCWWNGRDLKATMVAYRANGRSTLCPFCGYSERRTIECPLERGYAALCKACEARGPLIPYNREGRRITEDEARSPLYYKWISRDYMTARNTLRERVIL